MVSVYKRTWTGQDNRERVRWVAAYKDQHGRRHKGFLQRKDAKQFLVLTQGEIIRGVHTPENSSITVFEAAQLWLKHGELEDDHAKFAAGELQITAARAIAEAAA